MASLRRKASLAQQPMQAIRKSIRKKKSSQRYSYTILNSLSSIYRICYNSREQKDKKASLIVHEDSLLQKEDQTIEDSIMNCNIKDQLDTETRLDNCFTVEIHKNSSNTEIV